MKKNLGIFLRAIASIMLCICVAILSLCAVSTEKADANLALAAGDVQANARVTRFRTYSNGVAQGEFENYVSEFGGKFGTYGTATFRNNILSLNRLNVEDRVDFQVAFSLSSDSKTQYRLVLECTNDKYMLYDGLVVTVRSDNLEKTEYACNYGETSPDVVATDWLSMENGNGDDVFYISVRLPQGAEEFEGRGTQISVSVQVVLVR